MQVQEELVRRANIHTGVDGCKRKYSAKYALSSIVFCGECGEIYRRVHWNNRGCKSIVWRCVSRLEEKGGDCTSATINEEALQQCVVRAINMVIGDKEGFLAILQQNISTVLAEDNTEAIDDRLDDLQNELLRLANSGNQYIAVADEICRLRETKQSALIEKCDRQTKRQHIAEMTEFLNNQTCLISQYDDKLVRRLVERVTVFEARAVVGFRSGVEVGVVI